MSWTTKLLHLNSCHILSTCSRRLCSVSLSEAQDTPLSFWPTVLNCGLYLTPWIFLPRERVFFLSANLCVALERHPYALFPVSFRSLTPYLVSQLQSEESLTFPPNQCPTLGLCHPLLGAALVAQMVKNLPAVLETWVQSLGQKAPLEEGMAIHSSTLAWRIPMDRGAWRAAVHGVPSVRHDWAAEHGTAPLVETPAVLSWPEVFSSWILSLHSRLTWPTKR